tara:strand:- start:74 stop:310 length:237 start_codon:yes stop_codon:yes gene_type:complete
MIKKGEDWEVESDDQEFEKASNYFLTGVSDGSPDEAPAMDLKPVRHGVEEVWVSNITYDSFVSPLHVRKTYSPMQGTS